MPAEIVIRQIRERPGADDQGRPITVVEATFTVDAHGPFTVAVPQASFSGELLRRAIDEYARQVAMVTGA